jgi:hypothetical protein
MSSRRRLGGISEGSAVVCGALAGWLGGFDATEALPLGGSGTRELPGFWS